MTRCSRQIYERKQTHCKENKNIAVTIKGTKTELFMSNILLITEVKHFMVSKLFYYKH